ncbi:MAG TPA: hypothetical protein VE030_09070 [Burkholderiales bacterium]|nr:hypothetical protein [Burkholderiales bacterium]
MKISTVLTAVCAVLLIAACASKSDKPTRFELRGFSFTAPAAVEDEKPWGVAKRTPDLLILGKPGEFQSEVFTVQATVVRLPALASPDALLQYVKSSQQRELDPKRFRILKHELSLQPVNGESCALSHIEAVDRAMRSTTGPTANTMLETLTLTCAHPKDRNTGINVTYSQQYFPEDKDPRFLERGSAILEGLRLDGQP